MIDPHYFSRLLKSDPNDVKKGMRELLQLWRGRAVGLWSFDEDTLRLQHFEAVDDMPEEIQSGFKLATNSVKLSQNKFGIVSAVLSNGPSPAYVDPTLSPLRDSASWIEKFNCLSSLSVPVYTQGKITAVLAVSYMNKIVPTDEAWQNQVRLAQQLGS